MADLVTTNDKVLALLRSRLDLGQSKYGQDIPIQGENGRNNLKESIEESADLAVYLAATLLELDNKRDTDAKLVTRGSGNNLKIKPKSISFILSGLHCLYNNQHANNQLDICTEIDKLITDIKVTSKWDAEDETTLIVVK